MSNMYSLLNYIAATSKEISENSSSSQLLSNPLYAASDGSTLQSVETGLRGLSEDEKRLVGISTISVVTRLALEFQMEEVSLIQTSRGTNGLTELIMQVTRLTVSMLLQRLRSAEPTVEAAIAYNLVDLALSAPDSSFVDIIRAFSAINRSANPDDPRFSNNMASLMFNLGPGIAHFAFRCLLRRPDLPRRCGVDQNFTKCIWSSYFPSSPTKASQYKTWLYQITI